MTENSLHRGPFTEMRLASASSGEGCFFAAARLFVGTELGRSSGLAWFVPFLAQAAEELSFIW